MVSVAEEAVLRMGYLQIKVECKMPRKIKVLYDVIYEAFVVMRIYLKIY